VSAADVSTFDMVAAEDDATPAVAAPVSSGTVTVVTGVNVTTVGAVVVPVSSGTVTVVVNSTEKVYT